MPDRFARAAHVAALHLRLAGLLLALEVLGDDASADECILTALGPTYRRTARCGSKVPNSLEAVAKVMIGKNGLAVDLGPRQQRFVEEYLLDLNAKQAAIRAGYSPKTAEVQGSRLLSHVKVQRAVSEAIDRRAAKVGIDQEWVLSRLALVVERCLQHEQVRDREGNPVVIETPQGQLAAAYTFQPGAATRALELLGKHVGMFTDRLEVSGREGERLFGERSEEELIERLLVKRAARAKVIAGQVEDKSLTIEWGSRATGSRPARS